MRRWFILIALLGAALPARAGEHLPPVTDPAVKQACGACHMAYQPQFLPRDSSAGRRHRSGDVDRL